jgi:hypothetical protein
MYHYLYETSPDRKRRKSREATSPVDVRAADPLVDAARFNEKAWKLRVLEEATYRLLYRKTGVYAPP